MKEMMDGMTIEQHWDDIDVYLVSYQNQLSEEKMLDEVIIVPSGLEEELVKARLKLNFEDIKEVVLLEYFLEGLCLKKGEESV